MIVKGGTAYVDAGNLSLASSEEQTVTGLYSELVTALRSNKPVIINLTGTSPAAAVLTEGDSGITVSITGYDIAVTEADKATVTEAGGGGTVINQRFNVPDLPEGYQEVEYLTTDGDAVGHPYVRVDYSIALNDCIECGYNGLGAILGPDNAWNCAITENKVPLTYSSGGYTLKDMQHSVPDEDICGRMLLQFSVVSTETYFNYGLWRSNNTYVYDGKLYRLYVYNGLTYGVYPNEDDTLIVALIPCYNKTTNVAGFYDVINEDFLTAPEGRTFGVGPDVN